MKAGGPGAFREPLMPLDDQCPYTGTSELERGRQAYRSGTRTDSVMQAVATSLSDEETAALAHYLSTRGDQP